MLAKITINTDSYISRFASPAGANPLVERLSRLPRKIKEANHWSPTQQEVDCYISSLEHELLKGCEYMPQRLGNEYSGTAPVKGRPSTSFTLVWGLVAIAAGCFLELVRIILEALS